MSEEQNVSVEEQSQEAVAQAEVQSDNEQAQAQPARNDAEYNWSEMRRQMREKDREIAELRDQFSSITRKNAPPPEEDELAKLAEDDILTVSQAKKLATKLARQTAEQILKERENSTVDERIQSRYPDFMSTVTPENIEILKQTKPHLAKALLKFADDPYAQSELAYEYIKTYVPQVDKKASLDKKKAEENSKKPLSVQAAPKHSAIGQAHQFENGLTPELKNQLWQEMQNIKKMA